MSGRTRTFVLQVAGVAMLVAVIFFAFLRPSDPGDLAGIDAPGGEAPTLGVPGLGRDDGDGRDASEGDPRRANRGRSDGARAFAFAFAFASGAGSTGGPVIPPADGPPGDQYTSTAIALMERARSPSPGGDR